MMKAYQQSAALSLFVMLMHTPMVFGQNKSEPTNAEEAAAAKAKAEAILDQKYQTWVESLSPEEQAWERVLQDQLGSFYLPIHKQEKVAGKSNAWDFVRDDPKLPRVLIIGDSISRGYTSAVRKALQGKVNVHRAPANCGPTALGLKHLDVWLGKDNWDLIHFNFGIHDRNTAPNQYRSNLEALVQKMKPRAKQLTWASSTPVPDTTDGKYKSAPIVERNQIAAEVMQREQVAIDDLYSAILPELEKYQLPNDVHFNAAGYEFLGSKVSDFILSTVNAK